MTDRITLGADPASVGLARRHCAALLDRWYADSSVTDRVTLLVSELVTNAVLHAGTPCELAIERGDPVRVEVLDDDPTLPLRKHYAVDAASGRGMQLLEALSDRCGSDRTSTGKRVWFEVDLPVGA